MTRKIFRSIITVALLVLLVSIFIATSFLYNYFNKGQIQQLKSELAIVAETVNKAGIEYFENFDSAIFRFSVVNRDGQVIYDTEVNVSEMGNHADREEITEAIEYGHGSSVRYSSTLMKMTLYEAVLLNDGNILRVSVNRLTIGALLLTMLPIILVVIGFAVLLAFLLSYKMAKNVTEPLMLLDLDNPANNNTYEELNPILTKLHTQHRQIKNQINELHRKSGELEQIISAMNEGIVLLDEHGMVFSMNIAAKNIFDVGEHQNPKDFLMIDKTGAVSNAVWSALEGETSEFTEERNSREYRFNVNPIIPESKVIGVAVFAFDITEKAIAERTRKEFTANVSHELKTPLQAIIGSAELLESGLVKPEDTSRFIGNIKKEASRLVSLIEDIIRLSQLDEGAVPSEKENVDLLDLSNEIADRLKSIAQKRGIDLKVTGDRASVFGVRSILYEMVYNLCDNAIKYNTENGFAKINIKRESDKATLSVKDSGIGIASEDCERIFERFYRVDKSHSKLVGGTGLGLAIVKHGAAYHNAEINLESEEGKGTCVTITFNC